MTYLYMISAIVIGSMVISSIGTYLELSQTAILVTSFLFGFGLGIIKVLTERNDK